VEGLGAGQRSKDESVGSFTNILVVNPNLPTHSVKEMIDHAKANPGYLTFGAGNTAAIVALETIKHDTGTMSALPPKADIS